MGSPGYDSDSVLMGSPGYDSDTVLMGSPTKPVMPLPASGMDSSCTLQRSQPPSSESAALGPQQPSAGSGDQDEHPYKCCSDAKRRLQ